VDNAAPNLSGEHLAILRTLAKEGARVGYQIADLILGRGPAMRSNIRRKYTMLLKGLEKKGLVEFVGGTGGPEYGYRLTEAGRDAIR
jgi:DNA-binding PadR family transcriptional regulator